MSWLLGLLLATSAQADWIGVEKLSIDYVHYFPKGRAPLLTDNGLPDREPGHRVGFDLTLGLPATFYWGNRVESYVDHDSKEGGGQFRSVGWNFEFGTNVIPQMDVYYHHHSQHVLDHAYDQGFPVEDGVGVRFKIIGGPK
jgi:hypothetical protein